VSSVGAVATAPSCRAGGSASTLAISAEVPDRPRAPATSTRS